MTRQNRHIVIGGGSGFIGRALTQVLRERGDRVTIISRVDQPGGLTWDHVRCHGLPLCDVVINLAGKHILDMTRLWTPKYRDEVIRSRVETTETLVRAINAMDVPPELFISTAGKCYYGSQAFREREQYYDLDEHSHPVGVDFPSEVVSRWEAAALGIDTQRVRHVKLRLGIVLGMRPRHAEATQGVAAYGIFPLLHALFRRGLCLSMGNGVQPFPWVHIDDVVGVCLRAIDCRQMQDVFNVVAPGIVTNADFTRLLASKLRRSVLGRIPPWLIKMVVGVERSTILLLGQRVKPVRTMAYGYEFQFPQLEGCIDDLVNQTGRERA